jgi:hypothetical protein
VWLSECALLSRVFVEIFLRNLEIRVSWEHIFTRFECVVPSSRLVSSVVASTVSLVVRDVQCLLLFLSREEARLFTFSYVPRRGGTFREGKKCKSTLALSVIFHLYCTPLISIVFFNLLHSFRVYFQSRLRRGLSDLSSVAVAEGQSPLRLQFSKVRALTDYLRFDLKACLPRKNVFINKQ